jgi:hypothetical protein
MFSRLRRHATYANVAATCALILGLTGFAVAAIPSPDGVINGCYQKKKGSLRVIEQGRKCAKSEKPISWNQTGPKGAPGVQGTAGVPGAPGPTASAYAQNQNLGSAANGGSYATAVALNGAGGSGPVNVGFDARLHLQGVVSVTLSNTAEEGDFLEVTCKPQVAAQGSAFADAGPSSYVRVIQGPLQGGTAGGSVSVVGERDVAPGAYDARIVCASNGGGISNGNTFSPIVSDAIAAIAVAR